MLVETEEGDEEEEQQQFCDNTHADVRTRVRIMSVIKLCFAAKKFWSPNQTGGMALPCLE